MPEALDMRCIDIPFIHNRVGPASDMIDNSQYLVNTEDNQTEYG